MSELTEFLLDRIDEDEVRACKGVFDGPDYYHPTGHPDDHLLAECRAKRRIIELANWTGPKRTLRDAAFGPAADVAFQNGIAAAMRAMATVYAKHPDYSDTLEHDV